jgi:hypothetical protein
MTIDNGLITLEELAQFTGYPVPTDPSKIADVESAIETSSRSIEQYCGREFHQSASSPRYFDTRDGYYVWIDDAVSVSLVEIDEGDSGVYTAATNYQLLPNGGRDLLLGAVPYSSLKALTIDVWPTLNDREGAVKVTAVWGWAAVPTPVKRACAVYAHEMLRDREATFGGVLATTEGVAIGARIPQRVRDLLATYRRAERVFGIA